MRIETKFREFDVKDGNAWGIPESRIILPSNKNIIIHKAQVLIYASINEGSMEAMIFVSDPSSETDGKTKPVILADGKISLHKTSTREVWEYIENDKPEPMNTKNFEKPAVWARVINNTGTLRRCLMSVSYEVLE